jgi:glutathione synthase
MRTLFVMDPLETVDINHDSTFAIMLETQARGHEVLYCLVTDLSLRHGVPWATVQRAELRATKGDHMTLSEPFAQPLKAVDLIFMRKDPPFDIEYIFATYLLEAAEPEACVVNRPASLRSHNEKLYALQFPEFCPPTVVTGDVREVRAFQQQQDSDIVVKPLDGNGGEGIFVVRQGDPNLNVIVELSTKKGRRPVMAQRYLPEASLGDKRVLLVDGEHVGSVLRVPKGKDPRGNMVRGAVAEKTTLTPREQALVAALGPRLRADGHLFVGIDVIGDRLTEVNVTSPTGIHEVNRLDGVRVQTSVVEAMERAVAANRARQVG